VDDVVSYVVEDGVAWLTIEREDVRNALSAAVRDALRSGFERSEGDEDAQVLVLTGAGSKAFCAGGDLKEMAATKLGPPPSDFFVHLNRNLTLTKPVVAAVNGVAFGGGFLLAQMCDLVVAADHAQFGITEARWGRGAPWAAPLGWMIPPRVALELMMTAEPISAQRAYEVGLVNRVVPADQLKAETQRMAATIAGNAPLSVRASKAMVYAAAETGWTQALEDADRLWDPVYRSNDAQEGPRAFSERRAPRWTAT
jgi:enoyl-CoA hydratase/carnithine racemase